MGYYVRVKKYKNKDGSSRDYSYIVKSYWDSKSKSSKQEHILCIDRMDDPETTKMVDNLIRHLLPFSSKGKLLDLDDKEK